MTTDVSETAPSPQPLPPLCLPSQQLPCQLSVVEPGLLPWQLLHLSSALPWQPPTIGPTTRGATNFRPPLPTPSAPQVPRTSPGPPSPSPAPRHPVPGSQVPCLYRLCSSGCPTRVQAAWLPNTPRGTHAIVWRRTHHSRLCRWAVGHHGNVCMGM